MNPWDGHERRETVILNERLHTKTVEVPAGALIAGFIILGVLVAGVIWALIIHSGNQMNAADADVVFRDQLRCFVIRTVQGTPAPEVLDRCGFLTTGAPK